MYVLFVENTVIEREDCRSFYSREAATDAIIEWAIDNGLSTDHDNESVYTEFEDGEEFIVQIIDEDLGIAKIIPSILED